MLTPLGRHSSDECLPHSLWAVLGLLVHLDIGCCKASSNQWHFKYLEAFVVA